MIQSTDFSGWQKEDLAAFARVVEQFSAATDIRFFGIMDGQVRSIFIPRSSIDFLTFTEEECDLLSDAMEPPNIAAATSAR